MSGKLYVVGTPIGNLGDMSPRAVQTLAEVDFIAAEDTRVSVKLLNHFEIKKPMISYHEHNKTECGERIIARLTAGESCAIVTDAGMPAISDPGEHLVRLCHENGITVCTVPGPSAVITALAMSGMSCTRFCFEGFLPADKSLRRDRLGTLCNEERTMVFYEAPHKLVRTLRDMAAAFGEDRGLSLVKELTKVHEQAAITTLAEAVSMFEETPPRGEFVLVVAGARRQDDAVSLDQAVKLAAGYAEGGLSASKAAARAAADSGYAKSDIYRELIRMRG